MKIEMSLNASSIDKAIRKLRRYETQIERNVQQLLDRMVADGEDYAVNQLGHVDTGETLASIIGYRDGNTGFIVAGGAAVWIEFGTGVYRNQGGQPHPMASALGMSEWGTYGSGHGNNPDGQYWYYPDDSAPGGFSRTRGIEMNPFLYDTAQALRNQVYARAREVFRR